MEATTLEPVVTLPHSSTFTPGPTMTKGGLNRAIDGAFKALVPRRVREHERLQGDTDHSNTQQPPETAPPAPSGTSAPMNPASAPSAPSEAPPALPVATEVPAEPPAAPPVPADASAPVTEASLQAMLAESSEASVDQMMVSMAPYLTAIAGHQVQLHVSPPRLACWLTPLIT
ncbi:hypothetical protein PC129_g4365 [Phytophthora cactorum]|uniref:Uncharacterized protein n=2 Tax=Phytophthora cactorum TaxID=29920 RepID=A0A8T1IPY9_9STRA|nr:hypothetical protein PC111_g22373 [Phytophthora cactorum]KAG2818561.1 hypothetical protein PC112_g12574 [Phytophthora cactorum]KAG2913378.1 hypothetical protein PC115_g12068 [Phytophthora cactorum]KAG2916414.1 hypothetical protein PC114_g7498 [Phytophthora cactorum]KAG2990462.1 hypothetical protein PC118_g5617 [Phytophthora cactorum]